MIMRYILTFWFIVGIFCLNCGYFENKPRAIGSGIEWNIFASERFSTEFVKNLPPDTLRMPPREPFRYLFPVSPKEWQLKQKLANIVWILNANNLDQRELMQSLLTQDAFQYVWNGNVLEKDLPNLWAKPQEVIVFFVRDFENFQLYLKREKHAIENKMLEKEIAQLKWDLYRTHEQTKITKYLQEKYDFSIRIPRDWIILEEGENFLWLGKDYPMRWFSVSWKDGDKTLEINPWDWRCQIGEKLYQEISIDSIAQSEGEIAINHWTGQQIRGLWYHDIEPKGGPFSSVIFHDESANRWYFLDMQVYAPDRSKMRYLREMEVMAQTFKLE